MEVEQNENVESPTKEYEDALYASEDSKSSQATDVEADKSEEKPVENEEQKLEENQQETESDNKPDDKTENDEASDFKLELNKESLLDNSNVEDVVSFAKENNLTKDQAQQLLSKQEELLVKYAQSELDKYEAQLDAWREEVIKDPVMGGDNLKKTTENARRAVKAFGDDQFINLLNETGYGDNPEVVKFLSKIGALMEDDNLILPSAKAERQNKPMHEYFYGSNE
jgi:hypothetical protein